MTWICLTFAAFQRNLNYFLFHWRYISRHGLWTTTLPISPELQQWEILTLNHTVFLICTIHPQRRNPLQFLKYCSVNSANHANCCYPRLWLLMRFGWKLCIRWRRNDSQAPSWLALYWAVISKRDLSDGRSHLLSILVLSFGADNWWWWFPNNRNWAEDEVVTACIKWALCVDDGGDVRLTIRELTFSRGISIIQLKL